MTKTLLLDNYDSFTFNLFQLLAEVNGEAPIVLKNDERSWSEIQSMEFDNIVISPGPGRPGIDRDLGVCRQAILDSEVPLLGVCLGHQGLAHAYGGSIDMAPEAVHGRVSEIIHNGSALFREIPQRFKAVRYHSLFIAERSSQLKTTAWTSDRIPMAVEHRRLPLWGVQFHPESIGTEYGRQLLINFRQLTLDNGRRRTKGVDLGRAIPGCSRRNRRPKTALGVEPEYEVCSRRLKGFVDSATVFVHVFKDETQAFWLDSSHGDPRLSRFSFMGHLGPLGLTVRYTCKNKELTVSRCGEETRRKEDVFQYLEREGRRYSCRSDDLPFDFNCGFVGYFGYELKADCGGRSVHSSGQPDAMFMLADRMIAFDHREKAIYLLHLVEKGRRLQAQAWFDEMERRLSDLPPSLGPETEASQSTPLTFRMTRSHEQYLDSIRECQRFIGEGESYEVCLTHQIHTDPIADPMTLYLTLRRLNPAPYACLLRFGELSVLSSSPERFLRIDRERRVESKPIKGTRPRGETREIDQALREDLRNCAKDRAENLMIVDLVRNDLGRVCEIGSVEVPKLMDVETYETVHQLVSCVRGKLRPDRTVIDCIRSAFPGGSMTGAPKLRTMEILDDMEWEARGVYSGSVGYLSLSGAADLNIVIRTIVASAQGTSIGAGGAIVSLSDPESEFDETLVKAYAPIRAVIETIQGRSDPRLLQRIREQFRKSDFLRI